MKNTTIKISQKELREKIAIIISENRLVCPYAIADLILKFKIN